jgi:histidine kinase
MNRLREFGRKPDFAQTKVDLNRAIRIVHGIVAQQLKLQNIAVNLELEENIPFIMAHNTRLEQVTFNLVTNAQDAIRQKVNAGLEAGGSTITIRTFTENGQVVVTVADNGIGIPESVLHKVFEPFFTTKEVGKGMGLGLSITYGIVKDYNGQIEIQSREGIGTTIKLTFPYADA